MCDDRDRWNCCGARLLPVAAAVCWLLPCPAPAKEQKPNPKPLTVETIFDSSEFDARSFSSRWLADSSAYLTLENSASSAGGRDLVAWDPESGDRRTLVAAPLLVPPGESTPLTIDEYALSPDQALLLIYTNSRRVWRRNTRGDYWVLDRTARQLFQLGGNAPPSSLQFAELSPAGSHAIYVRDNNIYLEDLRSREIAPLTTAGGDALINGTFDWVYEEELSLRDGSTWSPDGQMVAFWQIDTRGVPPYTLANNTAGLYPHLRTFAYPKVGQVNPAARVGVVDISSRATRWMEIPGDPREHYLARMEWVPGRSDRLLVQQLNRRQNTNTLWLCEASTGQATLLMKERDDAWVDVHDELFWLKGGSQFTWISERDGWRHAYTIDRANGEARLVTPGEFDVIQLLQADARGEVAYLLASPANPTQRYLYRATAGDGRSERITPADATGVHDYQISPDCRWAIHTASALGVPPEVELVRLPGHASVRTLVDNQSLREKLAALPLGKTELFRVEIGEGVPLDGWCLTPPGLKPHQRYPLLVYVYGEPAGQTVLDQWGGKGYLWHQLLAQRGYVVMSFDNRGTPAPRGREWRKSIHLRVGILAPADQAAAVQRVLEERKYLDPERVGIWGWSGGGSMTLNALFKYPQLYRVGISIAPVPNQRLYDSIYQERYMGLPGDNLDGYLNGSAIQFAHQLEGDLLLVHGTGDDNCHYQGTEALINELVRLKKPFAMMAYPNRSHSISEGQGTTVHLRQLMTRYLEEHLPAGPLQ